MVRIAVINRDPSFVSLVSHLLAQRGWTTVACCDGTAAFDFVKRERPHAVLLDVRMEPNGRRWQLVPKFQRDPKTKNIPLIMCATGEHELRDRLRYLEARGVRALIRPFSSETLYRVLDVALRRRASSR